LAPLPLPPDLPPVMMMDLCGGCGLDGIDVVVELKARVDESACLMLDVGKGTKKCRWREKWGFL